jgi:hypothetical protein
MTSMTVDQMNAALMGALVEIAKFIEEEALVVCRVLPSTRHAGGYHVQYGHRNSYRKTSDFSTAKEAAAFLTGMAEAWRMTGRMKEVGT